VIDVDSRTATVTVDRHEALLRDEIALRDMRFVGHRPGPNEPMTVQVRAHASPVHGRLVGDRVRFEVPEARVAPGQVVALYRDDVLLGGGIAA
jgi:tRNA-uridine 2-sulfurtransferase